MRKPLSKSRRYTAPRPAPLLEWQPPLGSPRRARRRTVLIAGGIGLALIGLAAMLDFAIRPAPASSGTLRPAPPSASGASIPMPVFAPATWCWQQRQRAFASLPPRAVISPPVCRCSSGSRRRGDDVCALGRDIFINGQWAATRLAADRQGRPLPWWSGCEMLRNGRVFLLNDTPDSFDGRYFGPTDQDALIGKATPFWLR
jgi:hypothetical protein